MRYYGFGNMYLSSLQQGLQNAHAIAEMFVKYQISGTAEAASMYDWAENHKTMILLNAGYGKNIHALVERFDHFENPYPWADFHEEEASLDGAITCVGIVLPEKIYESAAQLRKLPYRSRDEVLQKIEETGEITWWDDVAGEQVKTTHQLSKWEFNFIQELNNYGLAS